MKQWWKELLLGWRALLLFLRGREAEAVALFADDRAAVVRSFVGLLLAVIVTAPVVLPALPEDVAQQLGSIRHRVAEDLLLWLVGLGVAIAAIWLLGRMKHASRFLVVSNWMGVWIILLLTPLELSVTGLNGDADAAGLGGVAGEPAPGAVVVVLNLLLLVVLLALLVVLVRMVRATLRVRTWQSVALNLAMLLMPVLGVGALLGQG